MQKSKKATIITIFVILLYGLLGSLKLIKEINVIYVYIINPIIWISFAVILYIVLGKTVNKRRLRKTIIQFTVIAALAYVIIYMLSGLVVTFGNNPYNTTTIGLIINFWTFSTVIIAKEYIRYKLINNVYDKEKTLIAVLISIVYVIIDFEFTRFLGREFYAFSFMKYILQKTIPYIAINAVFSYTTIYSNCIPAIIYQLTAQLYFLISPVIPNSPWIMSTVIDSTIPIILLLYVRYNKNKLTRIRSKEDIENSDPKSVIPLIILVVLGIWFAVGIFPIKPVAIATGSMEKTIFVGDIAIIKKCNPNDIIVGDIIEYQMEGYTVIHRVIEKKQNNGEFSFITKGDNNGVPDKDAVREDQLIGKMIFKIKYLGYPAIWLHILQTEEAMVEVETGNK